MKRDMDLLRDLILRIEKQSMRNLFFLEDFYEHPGVNAQVVRDHIRLLVSAGFLSHFPVMVGPTVSGRPTSSYEISWQGYEFIDQVRDPQIWEQTKEAGKKVGGWSIEILGEVAKGLIKTKIKQHTGVEI